MADRETATSRGTRELDLLRFATAGSVDDGKSTLIGRLLYDTKAIFQDHLKSVEEASRRMKRAELDLSLLTDGLRAEREQGITIDVAYRTFATKNRQFIIADTPGHEQYTRNMVTGASTASLILLLIDARHGIQTQSKRHAFISSLLGIPNVLVAINKMDLVDYSEDVYRRICREYDAFSAKLKLGSLSYVPVSALRGDNVVEPSQNMPWYDGLTILDHLESVYVGSERNLVDLRFWVQLAMRPGQDFRGYAGEVASGVVRKGDEVLILPSGNRSRVKSISNAGSPVEYAFPPQAITICLEDEVDISRGDMLVHVGNQPRISRDIEAIVVWMADQPLRTSKPYLVKTGTNAMRAVFSEITYRIDPNQLHREEAEVLELNEIGRVSLETYRPLVHDEFSRNKKTGSFIVIDPSSNATLGAGMIIDRGQRLARYGDTVAKQPVSRNIRKIKGSVTRQDREHLLGQKATTIWLTGLSGAGKSTIAYKLEQEITAAGHLVYTIDGDNIRHGLNNDLGFTPGDRQENIRRVAEVCALFNEAGVIVISAFISPYREDRNRARQIVGEGFVEVFVDAPLDVCEDRDPKGLYRKARAGEIAEF
ncbi:MAG: adenylyl-sulfate kinase, partial [Planctomycetota bacterium]